MLTQACKGGSAYIVADPASLLDSEHQHNEKHGKHLFTLL